MVSGISSADSVQPDLFEYNPEQSQKYKALSTALDKTNGKMGADTVLGVSLGFRR